jgi:hypothetical protein
MKRARGIVALATIVFMVHALCGCGGSSAVVVNVAGNSITKSTFDHWTAIAGGSAAASKRALGFLIASQWLMSEAAELGIHANDREAQTQLEQVAYDKREGIKYDGLPSGDLTFFFARARGRLDRLWLMRLAIMSAQVRRRQLADTEQRIKRHEIVAYYTQHKSLFVLPEQRDIQWIVTYSEPTLQKAVREIRAGKNFVTVARRVSLDPPTRKGMVYATEPEKDFARHVFAAKPHVLSGPFQQVQNHYMLEVTKVTPARLQSLAEVEVSIRRRLAARWVSTQLPRLLRQKWTVKTACTISILVVSCRWSAPRI